MKIQAVILCGKISIIWLRVRAVGQRLLSSMRRSGLISCFFSSLLRNFGLYSVNTCNSSVIKIFLPVQLFDLKTELKKI